MISFEIMAATRRPLTPSRFAASVVPIEPMIQGSVIQDRYLNNFLD